MIYWWGTCVQEPRLVLVAMVLGLADQTAFGSLRLSSQGSLNDLYLTLCACGM